MLVAPELATTKPYLIRALYEWCADQGLTPYITVRVDAQTVVPMQFVKDGMITLNVGVEAANNLVISNDLLEFKARFAGVVKAIVVPITHVMAIYGRENGQGMAFPMADAAAITPLPPKRSEELLEAPAEKKEPIKPFFTRVK